MEERMFSLDGEEFDLRVMKLQRQFAVGQAGDTFVTLDGGCHRQVLGTYYHYTMTVAAKPGMERELERFWEKISQPTERMLCRFPYGQDYLQQQMYVLQGQQDLISGRGGNTWDQITVRFIGALPQVAA